MPSPASDEVCAVRSERQRFPALDNDAAANAEVGRLRTVRRKPLTSLAPKRRSPGLPKAGWSVGAPGMADGGVNEAAQADLARADLNGDQRDAHREQLG